MSVTIQLSIVINGIFIVMIFLMSRQRDTSVCVRLSVQCNLNESEDFYLDHWQAMRWSQIGWWHLFEWRTYACTLTSNMIKLSRRMLAMTDSLVHKHIDIFVLIVSCTMSFGSSFAHYVINTRIFAIDLFSCNILYVNKNRVRNMIFDYTRNKTGW